MDLDSYKAFLKTNYPQAYLFLKQTQWRPLFFNENIKISIKVYKQIEKIIQRLYQLRNNKNYQKSLCQSELTRDSLKIFDSPSFESENLQKENTSSKPGGKALLSLESKKQDSVLMAYDFHLDNETVQLIEVNTNASAFLLVNSLYQFKKLNHTKALEDLKSSFQKEWSRLSRKTTAPKKVVLIDQEPLKQKMAVEFFMYKDFFQSMGWDMEILDSKQLKADDKQELYSPKNEKIDFIYNRSTDFYFENHPLLAKAYQESACVILPQPKDYFLLADKARMADWFSKDWTELKEIKNNLLKTQLLNSQNKQEFWQNRKKYFFKISQGHGGKMAYRGSSISRKKFEELFQYKSLAQEYSAPSRIKDSKLQEWKLDLRAYVYKDHIQQLVSRVYQGQLTNFKAPGSGFATVTVSK